MWQFGSLLKPHLNWRMDTTKKFICIMTLLVRTLVTTELSNVRVSGSIHTWCPGSNARTLAQNSAVFRHLVPYLKICLHSVNRAHAHVLWNCGWSAREPKQNVFTQGPSAQFGARVQGLPVVLGHGHRARILALGTWKRCGHAVAQLRTVPGHRARALIVNTAWISYPVLPYSLLVK